MNLQMNIGLNVNGVPTLTAAQTMLDVRRELKPWIVGANHYASQIAASGEETLTVNMLIMPINRIGLERIINRLCKLFNQDCIAGKLDGKGFLIGPVTEPYGGAFNAEYWLEPVTIDPKDIAMRDLIECFDRVILNVPREIGREELIKVNAIREKMRRAGGF